MDRVARALDVRNGGATAGVRNLLWKLMDRGVVHGLLVPLQTSPRELPTPTLIKTHERLEKATPLAPVMSLNSAKIAAMLLEQESDKRLGVVMRPCEARALKELADCGVLSLDRLITISIDCLGSHDEPDYAQRVDLWGSDAATRESLRWSRQGQIASYRYRRACQVCAWPHYDSADISVGLFGQRLTELILVFVNGDLAERIGLDDDVRVRAVLPNDQSLAKRHQTIDRLVSRRLSTRKREFADIFSGLGTVTDLLAEFDECSLCGGCQKACPLAASPLSKFEMDGFVENTREYAVARLLDIALKSEHCSGCGMCEAACSRGIPLMFIAQLLSERPQLRQELVAALK